MALRSDKRFVLLATIMAAIMVVLAVATIGILYIEDFNKQRDWLAGHLKIRMSMIDAIAKFDNKHSPDFPGGSRQATLTQILEAEAEAQSSGFGETGEFQFAYLEDGVMHFMIGHRHPVPGHEFEIDKSTQGYMSHQNVWLEVPLDGELAKPMSFALKKQEGTVVAPDYRGEEVLASYGYIDALGLGIVAKIDLKEVRAPYLRATKLVSGLVVILIVLGTALFFYLGEPIIRQLRTSKERLNRVIEEAPVPIVTLRANGVVESVNQQFENTFGWTKEDVPTKDKWWVVAYPDESERESAQTNWERMFQEDGEAADVVYSGQRKIITKDGQYVHVDFRVTTVGDLRIVSFVDVTHRLRYEEEMQAFRDQLEQEIEVRTVELHEKAETLSHVEGRLQSSLTFANIGAWEWNIQTGELYWSDQIPPLFGYKKGEVDTTYEAFIGAVHPDDREGVEQAISLCVSENKRYEIEHRVIWPDGTVHWVQERGDVKRDEQGKPTFMLGIVLDISHHKQALLEQSYAQSMLEKQAKNLAVFAEDLEQARIEAENANKAKSSFLAVMSHEIRTPLNGVIGMVDLLRETALTPDQKHMVSTVRESSLSLLYIINDILDFSKIEAGRLELDETPVIIRHIIDACGNTFGTVARKKNVDFFIFEDPNLPDCVYADGDRLRQIVMNLVGNAIKFTDEHDGQKGRIVLSVELGTSITNDDQSVLVIEVSDTGIGIAPESQERLFQSFSQADGTINRRFGGTGLGLAICRSLTEMMGGEISVSSALGQGSTFSVKLPLRVASASQATPLPNITGLRIALFSNSKVHQGFLRTYLDAAGAECIIAQSMQELVDCVRSAQKEKRPIDVAVMDVDDDIQPSDPDIQIKELSATARGCVVTRTSNRNWASVCEGLVVVPSQYPLGAHAFIEAVAIAAGIASAESEPEHELEGLKTVSLPTLDEAEVDGQLVLLVEDNLVNQDVIIRQLNMLGYVAIVAENGRDALKQLEYRRVGLILTDLHMPSMDGYSLAKHIRDDEKGTDVHVPILAITAAALTSELNHCFEVGMDGYVTKPVTLVDLKGVMDKWLPLKRQNPNEIVAGARPQDFSSPGTDEHTDSPVDASVLEQIVGSDKTVQAELIEDFLRTTEPLLLELDGYFQQAQVEEYQQLAHRLKSSSRTFGAIALGDLLEKVERAGKVKDWETITEWHPQILPNFADVKSYYNNHWGQ